jgi:hypothetical protein
MKYSYQPLSCYFLPLILCATQRPGKKCGLYVAGISEDTASCLPHRGQLQSRGLDYCSVAGASVLSVGMVFVSRLNFSVMFHSSVMQLPFPLAPLLGNSLPYWSTGLITQISLSFTGGRTPWTGYQLVARPLPKHKTTQTQKNADTH